MSVARKYACLAARLLANSVHDPLTGCRIWTGKRAKRRGGGEDGRLNIRINGRHVTCRAHRISFEVFNGPIPEGHEIDHTCVNSLCIEPTHLEAVTHIVNVQRRDQREMDRNIARGAVAAYPPLNT
ncbi:MAG: HNH endonuclease signature motif containing protein [Terriglobia bacterium]|nr:HNH endonuclease signature motif containing protein [Terriglobia bacterium]